MSTSKTSTPQQFILGPNQTPHVPGARPSTTTFHDPKAQKEKMSTFKRHLAASRLRSDEAIRRQVELLKEQRAKTQLCKSDIQRNMEAASKARMEEELGRPVSSNEWPFVYFVVTLDQFPVSADDPNADHGTKVAHTARERQRFLTSRRRKIQEARNETERIREAGIDMGLRLEPIKPAAPPPDSSTMQKLRSRPSMTKHPPTPVSSIGSRPEFSFLNSHDDLSEVEQTRRNIGYLISDTLSQAGVVPKSSRACPVSSLELPEISASAKRRALGTSGVGLKGPGLGERRVTFAEGLPVIKGNGIPVASNSNNNNNNNTSTDNSITQPSNALGTTSKSADFVHSPMPSVADHRSARDRKSAEEEMALKPPWSTPLTTRSLSSLSSRSRLYAPMALPKVDIVSEIYDELIVKTIHNFLMAEGYSNDKLQQLRHTVLARLSATYPHLVKHKAWRLTHSPCDKLSAADEVGQEIIMADPDRLQPRVKANQGRLNRVVIDKGLTYDQMRPFTSPHGSQQCDSDLVSQSFMAVDGRTVTFNPRDELRTRPGLLATSASASVGRKLPTTAEEREDDVADSDGRGDSDEARSGAEEETRSRPDRKEVDDRSGSGVDNGKEDDQGPATGMRGQDSNQDEQEHGEDNDGGKEKAKEEEQGEENEEKIKKEEEEERDGENEGQTGEVKEDERPPYPETQDTPPFVPPAPGNAGDDGNEEQV